MKLIGENLGSEVALEKYEAYYREGDKGEIRLYVAEPLQDIGQLEATILSQGVVLTEPIRQVSRVVIIRFEKHIAPLLIIGGAIVAIVGSIVGWQIFKSVQLGVPVWIWLVGGGALLYLLLREPVKKAAPYAIHAGKVYVEQRYGKKWLKE